MSQLDVPRLDSGDPFPAITLNLLDGSEYKLPSGRWTVMIFYRGEW